MRRALRRVRRRRALRPAFSPSEMRSLRVRWLLPALTAFLTAGGLDAQVVVGRVVDAASGAGVPRARVSVQGGAGSPLRQTHSAPDGRFSLVLGSGGEYRLEVARLGYRDARPRFLTVPGGDTLRVAVSLSAVALRLAPLRATARPRRLEISGDFREVRVDSLHGPAPASARGRHDGMRISGTIPTPGTCYRLAGAAYREGPALTVIVEARPSDTACFETGGLFSYRMTVRGLARGGYPLRVIHAYRDEVWERALALDTTVTVP